MRDIKAAFQSEWASVAAAWQKWQEPFAVQTAAASAVLVEQSGVREGMRVLDLASGRTLSQACAATKGTATALVIIAVARQ